MRLHRPNAFAGFLIVAMLALVGFAAFSATGARAAPPIDIPDVSARVAGALLGVDLGPDPAAVSLAPPPAAPAEPAQPPTTAAPATTTPPAPAREAAPATTTAPPPTTTAPTTAAPTTTQQPSTTPAPPPTTEPAPPTTEPPPPTTTITYPPGIEGGVRDVEEWRPLVEQYFPPERVDEALSVMECESQGNPLAQHPVTLATGLFQFIPNTWDWASGRAGWAGHSAFEPEANVAAAAWLVEVTIEVEHPRGAWAHWTCQPDPAE